MRRNASVLRERQSAPCCDSAVTPPLAVMASIKITLRQHREFRVRGRETVGSRRRLPRARDVSVRDDALDPTRGTQHGFKTLGGNVRLRSALRSANLRMAFGNGAPGVVVRVEFDQDRVGGKLASAFAHERRAFQNSRMLRAAEFEAAASGADGHAARLAGGREIEFDIVLDAHDRVVRAV